MVPSKSDDEEAGVVEPAFRPCVLIPTYDNPATLADVVRRAREHLADVLVIDDGSGPSAQAACRSIEADGLAHVYRRTRNGGKGAAVKDGFRLALERGFTHAVQIDADGQHALDDIPRFLAQARAEPDALILGEPQYDASAPASRLFGRKITCFWTRFETGGRVDDPMCGFRVYPLWPAVRAGARGNRMDFDIEIAVRMVWQGVPVATVPTQVRYLAPAAGGVSHFRLVADNVRISWLHTRLSIASIWHRLRTP